MTMKEEYTAHDMATAAADGFRDGQRAALDHSAQSIGMVGALVTALDGLLSITQDSTGVAGYHLNGNVAEWDEFPEVSTALDVLNLYRERADKPCFFGIDLAQGALDAGPWRDAIIDQGWTPPGQQQASDKVPCKTHPDAPHGFCRNSSHTEGRYVCECEHWEEPQASGDESRKLSDLGNELHNLSCHVVHVNEDWAEQIGKIACELWKWPQASSGQSAPAAEREAFRVWCESIGYPAALMTCGDLAAFQAGAAWQRTQAAGVPDALREAVEYLDDNPFNEIGAGSILHRAMRDALAAAPAHPAERQEPLHVTHRPLIRNAISLLRMRKPVAPDVERVAADLEAMLDGQQTPAGEPSGAWLQVAEQVDQQEALHVWRATTRLGETCHFGEASTARAWAGENGTVERVDLTPVPELRVVERHGQSDVQRLREALESAEKNERHRNNSETRYWCDQYKQLARAMLAASTGQEVGHGNQ